MNNNIKVVYHSTPASLDLLKKYGLCSPKDLYKKDPNEFRNSVKRRYLGRVSVYLNKPENEVTDAEVLDYLDTQRPPCTSQSLFFSFTKPESNKINPITNKPNSTFAISLDILKKYSISNPILSKHLQFTEITWSDLNKNLSKYEDQAYKDIPNSDGYYRNILHLAVNTIPIPFKDLIPITEETIGNESMNTTNTILTKVEWDYNKEFDKYIDIFLPMSNQMAKDMSVYDYDTYKQETVQFIKEQTKNWKKYSAKVFLYFNNNEVVGYVFLMDSMYKKIRAKWISELFIKPLYRNKGYGTIVLTDIINYLKEQKYQRTFLTVYEQNSGARQLYERLGFTTFDRVMELGLENFNNNKNIVYLDLGNEGLLDIFSKKKSILKEEFIRLSNIINDLYEKYKLNKDMLSIYKDKVDEYVKNYLESNYKHKFLNIFTLRLNRKEYFSYKKSIIDLLIEFKNNINNEFDFNMDYDKPAKDSLLLFIGFSDKGTSKIKDIESVINKIGFDNKTIDNTRKDLIEKIKKEIKSLLTNKYKNLEKSIEFNNESIEYFINTQEDEFTIFINSEKITKIDELNVSKIIDNFIKELKNNIQKYNCSIYSSYDKNDVILTIKLNNKGNESFNQINIDPEKFNSIKTVAIYQPEAVKGLHIFPSIYKLLMEEIDRCSKKRSYLTMYSESPVYTNIYSTSVFDIIRDMLKGTGTNLEIVDDKLTLNTNKFYFKDDTKVLKTLYKLQWDKKSYDTLKDIKIPEFLNMINEYRPKYESIKEQLSQYQLLPSEIYPSFSDQKLASANKKRVDGLFQIVKKIEDLYENVYVEFVNSITKQLIQD